MRVDCARATTTLHWKRVARRAERLARNEPENAGPREYGARKIACYKRRMKQDQMSNDELLAALKAAGRSESELLAHVITMLIQVEDRRLHFMEACSSMFDFCLRKLGMSGGEAYRRIAAARLVRDFPQILEAVRTRRVHLTNVVLMRDLFTRENVVELLAEAAGKTKREVEQIVATRAPKPDARPLIRKLPESKPVPTPAPAFTPVSATAVAPPPPPPAPPSAVARPSEQIVPLAETRHRVQFTASTELRKKLERAQSLMRHRNVDGDLAVVVERAMDLLIAELEKQKLAATKKPKTAPDMRKDTPSTRSVSAAARREVVQRDGEQCSFVGSNGERCPARDFLEIDHRHPRALGGKNDAANLRLLCRSHNVFEAEQIFGCEHIARAIHFRQRKKLRPSPSASTSAPPEQPRLPLT